MHNPIKGLKYFLVPFSESCLIETPTQPFAINADAAI